MDSAEPADAAAAADLVAHLAWVQRLARALVRDADRAEEVAQDALRVTLEQPVARVGPASLKAWLRGVVRRLVVDRSRAEASRARRERAAAQVEAAPPTHEIVARLDLQQRVAKAVRELAEPYRSAILYRYLDELPFDEVAKRTGVDVEAAKKRVQRGLAQLRARLDAEFGSETQTWAVSLLSLPGVAAVGAKLKLAVALLIVVAGISTWRALPAFRASRPPVAAQDARTPLAAAGGGTCADATAPMPADSPAPVRTPVADAARVAASGATIVHVSVVTKAGDPCTQGRLVGWWYDDDHVGPAGPRQRIDLAIEGATTDVVLPRTAHNLRLAASVEGAPPSATAELFIGDSSERKARTADVERRLTIEVGAPVEGPRLSGRILVDGVAVVPKGLELQFEPDSPQPTIEWRVHALDATYEAGPLKATFNRLMVRSDETVPVTIPLALDGNDASLDLALTRGRTLRLSVVDLKSGEPLPGFELFVNEESFDAARGNGDFQSHYVVTDAEGRCEVRGVPKSGTFEVRRDCRLVVRGVPKGDPEPRRYQFPPDPLFELRLTPDLPELIERTIRVDRSGAPRRVFGVLARELLATSSVEEPVEVRFSLRRPDLMWIRNDIPVVLDSQGGWQFDAVPDHDYKVWVERGDYRITPLFDVHVAAEDAGPVELASRSGSDVLVRLIHLPEEGQVRLRFSVRDGREQSLGSILTTPIRDGRFERRFPIDAPTTVTVTCGRDDRELAMSPSHRLEIDPATDAVAELDFTRDPARGLELTLTGGTLPPSASVLLMHVKGGVPRPDSYVFFGLADGRSRTPVFVRPGRYLFLLFAQAPIVVAGVVDVDDGKVDAPIALHCDLEPRAKSELGAGLDFSAIGDVQLAEDVRSYFRVRFDRNPALASAPTILVAKGLTWTVLAK